MARSKKENPSPSETDGTSRRHNRRQALGLAGVAAAAAAVAAVGMNGGKKAQAGHGPADATNALHLGQDNDAGGSQTSLRSDLPESPSPGDGALRVTNLATGPTQGGDGVALHGRGSRHGVFGTSVSGPSGVIGFAGDSGPGGPLPPEPDANFLAGVLGMGEPAGVLGLSGQIGVRGESQNGPGVFGIGDGDIGVFGAGLDGAGGFSPSSVGGRFASGSGIGLRGVSPGDAQPGVEAASGVIDGPSFEPDPDGGLALDVIGKARFSTAGDGVVPAGADAAAVSNPAVTPDSHIMVTLMGDPGNSAAAVQWVERQGSGFVVHLRVAVSNETPFTYLIVEPGA